MSKRAYGEVAVMVSLWQDESWRKPVNATTRKLLLLKQKGKCARCRKTFASMKVKPILHHTAKSNQIRFMQLICPNCHSKGAHVIKKRPDGWGGMETVVVRKKFGRKKTAKKKKRKRKSSNQFEWTW